MKNMRKMAAIAMALTLPLGLSACGGDGGDKPSKDDVKAGLVKAVNDMMGDESIPGMEEAMDELSGCIVDGVYDDFSAENLEVLANGGMGSEDAELSADEEKVFNETMEKCMAEFMP